MADKNIKRKKEVLGGSGTNIFAGIITEEYNPTLSGIKGIKIYDEMRKSDATVRAAMQACQLPIRRANWFIKTASEDKKDIEIRDFVERALFDEMSITWDDFLRQALLMLPFGVMVFEKVYDIKEIDGVNRVIWKKFGPRMPVSITHWETSDGEPGIQQLLPTTGKSVSIPLEKLLVFVNEIEGENWWGTSVFRAAYKHWYMKSQIEKIDAVAHERQGLGVPAVTLPPTHTDEDVTKAENILKNLRASEKGYLIEYDGISVEFKDMKANTTRDPSRAIAYHNRQIVLSVLAQFLDLGSGSSGSRSLSEDHTSLFLQSLEAIANGFTDVINKYAIKELVDLNFENVEVYPELDYNGISRVDVDKLSTAYQRFQQSGGLKPTKRDDQYVRELMGLPENTEEEVSQDPAEDADIKDTVEEIGMSESASKKKVEKGKVEEAVKNKLSEMPLEEQEGFLSKNLNRVKKFSKQREFFDVVELVLSEQWRENTRKKFEETNEYKSFRALTFAEKKVNFKNIEAEIDRLEEVLTVEGSKQLVAAKDNFIKKLTPLIEKKDTKGIADLEVKFNKEYSELLNTQMKDAYTYAKNNAAREMGVKPPASNKDALKSIALASDSIAKDHAQKLTREAKQIISDHIANGESAGKTIGAVEAAMAKAIEKVTRDTASIVIAGNINVGRKTVFDANEEKIYALQRSEILDTRTCNFCLSIDNRIVDKTDPLGKKGIFHSSCRGIWVEILEAEEEKPKITGVPESVRSRAGDAVNELLQPKKPIVKKDSPANKKIEKGKAGKNASEHMSTHPEQYGECGGGCMHTH